MLAETCSGTELARLTGDHPGDVTSINDVDFTPDGRFLVTSSADGTVRIWGIPGASEASLGDPVVGASCLVTPTPLPSDTPTITPTYTPSITPTPSDTPTLTATYTPSLTPTPTATATPLPAACADAPVPRLVVGEQGRVLDEDPSPINMRSGPGTGNERIAQVPAGAFFDVLEGPLCEDGYFWYRINADGLDGWVAEGVPGSYFTEPAAN